MRGIGQKLTASFRILFQFVNVRGDAFRHLVHGAGHLRELIVSVLRNAVAELAGDECLRAVAKALAEMIEASNRQGLSTDALVARYGGEEFTVVLPGATREAYALIGQRAVAVIAGLGIPHIPNQPWGVVTTSIGGAHTQSATEKVAALFRCADEKLYAAKAAGRNQLAAA